MATRLDDATTIMNRLNQAEQTIGITAGRMHPVFEVLCGAVAGKTLAGQAFPTIVFLTVAQIERKMEALQQGPVRYNEEWRHLAGAKMYLLMHYKEFIVAIFGDENNDDCRQAIEMVGNMLTQS